MMGGKPGLAIALLSKGKKGMDYSSGGKYVEKEKEDDYRMASRAAFEDFYSAKEAGKKDKAYEALKAFVEICVHEYEMGEHGEGEEDKDY